MSAVSLEIQAKCDVLVYGGGLKINWPAPRFYFRLGNRPMIEEAGFKAYSGSGYPFSPVLSGILCLIAKV
jgi:hypothetical protein